MGRQNRTRQKKIKYCDYSLFFLVIFLLGFGLVMLYSVSAYNSQDKFGNPLYYLKRQGLAMILGVIAMIVISKIDYHVWIHFGNLAYLIAIVLCTVVIFINDKKHGSARWLPLGPLSFQPSELAKLAMILFLAGIVCRIPKQIGKFSNLLKVMAMVVPIFIIVAIANLSTAIIIMGIAIVVTFVASPKIWQFVVMGVSGILGGGVLFILAASYRMDRIEIWLHPEDDPTDKGFQTLQGLYAIGSGGLFGKGLGQSMQKLGFLPEAQNDMVFSIICEELGLFGAFCVIMLFLLMIWRLMVIANNAADLYGTLIVSGIMAHIAIQVILNIAVVTNTIPNTGITLPFISYGGTATSFLLAEMGLALSVSRGIRLEGSSHD
ncbi:MAG: putative lipid II flippase FtsW [Eubacterium sp.]|nr:putative lipid II flippase FtsW [Eubacterium sp.]MCI8918526.1 putative lipid II flippase FtsW [Eubacterium sp.]